MNPNQDTHSATHGQFLLPISTRGQHEHMKHKTIEKSIQAIIDSMLRQDEFIGAQKLQNGASFQLLRFRHSAPIRQDFVNNVQI